MPSAGKAEPGSQLAASDPRGTLGAREAAFSLGARQPRGAPLGHGASRLARTPRGSQDRWQPRGAAARQRPALPLRSGPVAASAGRPRLLRRGAPLGRGARGKAKAAGHAGGDALGRASPGQHRPRAADCRPRPARHPLFAAADVAQPPTTRRVAPAAFSRGPRPRGGTHDAVSRVAALWPSRAVPHGPAERPIALSFCGRSSCGAEDLDWLPASSPTSCRPLARREGKCAGHSAGWHGEKRDRGREEDSTARVVSRCGGNVCDARARRDRGAPCAGALRPLRSLGPRQPGDACHPPRAS
ncbi:hypothetical protein T484DRAFT_1942376 [Baffinella frigidus]|nr:hypothetical protein T484DRAFT_1942376 [Cryptophyta sp. CCMP2293]